MTSLQNNGVLRICVLLATLFCPLVFKASASTLKKPEGMVRIPSGFFIPLYKPSDADAKNRGQPKKIPVSSFWIDTLPVSNNNFLNFVQQHLQWQKSKVPPIFADASYLKRWQSDIITGDKSPANAPVVHVSWFAAKAYCQSLGKRLPTVTEWEYVAQADELNPDASNDKKFLSRILQWYGKPNQEILPKVGTTFRNLYGVYDMHGLIWEWTQDFNTALVTGESRGDSELERSLFCGSGSVGASSFKDYAAFMRYGFRSSLKANYVTGNLGFRCAQSVE